MWSELCGRSGGQSVRSYKVFLIPHYITLFHCKTEKECTCTLVFMTQTCIKQPKPHKSARNPGHEFYHQNKSKSRPNTASQYYSTGDGTKANVCHRSYGGGHVNPIYCRPHSNWYSSLHIKPRWPPCRNTLGWWGALGADRGARPPVMFLRWNEQRPWRKVAFISDMKHKLPVHSFIHFPNAD